MQAVRRDNDLRVGRAPSDKMRAAVRTDVSLLEQLTLEARCREGGKKYRFLVDEPASRGGLARGPAPLSYFLGAAGACLLTQYAKLAILHSLGIDTMKILVLGHIDRHLGGGFTDITYQVRLTGSESPERVKRLADEAERCCFVHNTLKRALRTSTRLYLNGALLDRSVGTDRHRLRA